MKKKLIIFLWLVIILFSFNCNVYATGGGLRKNTIKTCSNGITYGLHSDGPINQINLQYLITWTQTQEYATKITWKQTNSSASMMATFRAFN